MQKVRKTVLKCPQNRLQQTGRKLCGLGNKGGQRESLVLMAPPRPKRRLWTVLITYHVALKWTAINYLSTLGIKSFLQLCNREILFRSVLLFFLPKTINWYFKIKLCCCDDGKICVPSVQLLFTCRRFITRCSFSMWPYFDFSFGKQISPFSTNGLLDKVVSLRNFLYLMLLIYVLN